jgi:hypothetical protein
MLIATDKTQYQHVFLASRVMGWPREMDVKSTGSTGLLI